MKRRIISTFVLVLMVVAAFAKPYRVTASKLNVRSTPDASGAIVGSLTQNTQVEVKRITGDWAEITFNGQKAYISAQHITAVSASSSSNNSGKSTTTSNNTTSKSSSSHMPPPNPRKNKQKNANTGNSSNNNTAKSNTAGKSSGSNMPPTNPRKNKQTADNSNKKGEKVQVVVENNIEESMLKGFRATYDLRWATASGSFRQNGVGKFQPMNMGADKRMINGLTTGFGFEYNAIIYRMSAANIMVGGRTGISYDYTGSGSFKGTANGSNISGRCSYHSFTFPLQPQVSFEWKVGNLPMGFGFFTGPVFEAYFMRNLWKFGTTGSESGMGIDMGVENYVTGRILGTGGGTIPEENRSGSFNCMWDTGFFLQTGKFRFFFSTAWGMHNFVWTRGGNGVTPVQAHVNRPVAFGFQTLLGGKKKAK